MASSRHWQTEPRPPFLPALAPQGSIASPLQDKIPIDLCQPSWSNAFRFTKEVLSGY